MRGGKDDLTNLQMHVLALQAPVLALQAGQRCFCLRAPLVQRLNATLQWNPDVKTNRVIDKIENGVLTCEQWMSAC